MSYVAGGCTWLGCGRVGRSQSWIRCAAVLEGGVTYAWIDDLRHGIRYLVRDAGVIGRCTTPQHENGGLRKIKDCLKLRKVGEPTLRHISIARKGW